MKQGQLGKRPGGHVPVLVIGVRIGLMGGMEPLQRILVGRGMRHRSPRTVVNEVEDGMVKLLMGVVGHAATLPADPINTRRIWHLIARQRRRQSPGEA
jgi:hypothetical protein